MALPQLYQAVKSESPSTRISSGRGSAEDTKPQRQGTILTIEVLICAAISFMCVVNMIACVVDFSSHSKPFYRSYQFKLSNSWLGHGILLDNSDGQYADFRRNLNILIPLLLLHVGLSNAVQQYSLANFEANDPHFQRPRVWLSFAFSTLFFLIYNGLSGFLKLVLVLGLNFALAKMLRGSRMAPFATWAYGLTVLIGTHYFKGFEFAWISPVLKGLDSMAGMNNGWYDPLRFCFLRMISFNFDYYWRCGDPSNEKAKLQTHMDLCNECSRVEPFSQCTKSRMQIPQPTNDYNIVSYFTYTLYLPLYLAGPIISFNDFHAQMKRRPVATNPSKQIRYILRWIVNLAIMETFMHVAYVIAIAGTGKVWMQGEFSAFQVACLGFFNLKHIWLKLLVIWRFFRMWALLDGIETVENMNRCMTNNYSAGGFWRSWHRSFNRWIIRYIYVPLGGSKMYILNLIFSFTFVAIWHDLGECLYISISCTEVLY
ncbi:MBOAT, membrane-bound O-acyltransferase family-domain-containing protein [Chytriomyces sp. MP71]|nr:MBOAT, membrane-bound O-acyltransferase family-domain-containing protein [Chytriomyces sp. MP71]